jgi:hypothetical protein
MLGGFVLGTTFTTVVMRQALASYLKAQMATELPRFMRLSHR